MTILMWIGIVLGGLVLILVVLPIAWLMIKGTRPRGVAIEVAAPALVPAGEPFDIVVRVRNLLDRERTLRSIDLDNALLKGFSIESLTPEPIDKSSMLGTTAFHYKLTIPPRASVAISLRGRSLDSGDYSGTVMAYVDSANATSEDTTLRLVVR